MIRFYAMNLWRWKCGLPEVKLNGVVQMPEQWSKRFESLMRNRLIVGAYRYGPMKHTDKPQYDRIGAAVLRLKSYESNGNAELLVDAANLIMLEFEESNHPRFHFASVDDGEHVPEAG